MSEGLSLGHGRWEQYDVNLTWTVHADRELLLDVRTSARAGDDRERARQLAAERLEQRRQAGQDRVLPKPREMDPGQERARARLLGRSREDDRARVGEAVERVRDPGHVHAVRVDAMDDEAGRLRVRSELVDNAH